MNILSLFDGMSCGMIAAERAGLNVNSYYASEIDKYAQTVSNANYPQIIRMGDVTKWHEWNLDWSSIDLLIGGSPCQGFSFAGKQLAFNDPRSALFFKFVEILRYIRLFNPKVKFLLENVKMKKEHLDVISETLGVEPVFINSALVSAQNRQRYYWCNWVVSQPEDKGIMLADILESDGSGVLKDRGSWCESRYKANCVDANYWKGVDNHAQRTMIVEFNDRIRGCSEDSRGFRFHRGDVRKSGISELGRILKTNSKTDAMTTSHPPKIALNSDVSKLKYRMLTPVECERLQTISDNYTNHVSNTQRYKMLGNGWTVDVIAHIFSCMGKE